MAIGNIDIVDGCHRFGWNAKSAERGSGRLLLGLLLSLVVSCATVPKETPYNLGVAAYKKRNFSEAEKQWSRAVANGDIEAMNNLGYLIYNGYGVDKDPARAMQLWQVAAQAGESEAQWHLGNGYEMGIGVEGSAPKAYAWYQCAIETASNNINANRKDHDTEQEILNDAKQSLDKIKASLSTSDLEKGRSLAQEYIGRYGSPSP